jgi:N-acetylneuraminic acid mutarotase
VGVIGSKIHVVPSNSTSHQIYDTAGSGAWTSGTAVPRAAHYRAGGVVDGRFYLLGGGSPGAIESVDWNYVYDPATRAWSSKKALPTARGYVTSAVHGGEIFVIGGPNISGKTLNRTIEAYDPTKDSWRSGALLPSGTMWPLYSAIGVVGGKIYKLGGGIWTKPFDTAYAYDVTGDTWSPLKSLPVKNHGPAGAVVDGKVYIIGGIVELLTTPKVWIYDPAKDSYASGPPLPISVSYSSAVTVNKCIYLISGHDSVNKDRTAKLFLKYCP